MGGRAEADRPVRKSLQLSVWEMTMVLATMRVVEGMRGDLLTETFQRKIQPKLLKAWTWTWRERKKSYSSPRVLT